ncbi:MAG: 2-hydroxyacid dehydrogenase [Spirochaetaceae bacterium]|jgi:D-lactate dehydrogenase|nr:2-hydroxyacid dehydrogenase [Spirochaetaceae bacterium]
MKTIAFFDTKPYDKLYFDKINRHFGFNIHYFDVRLNEETAQLAKGADAVCAFVNDRITASVAHDLEQQHIKLIALRCAGYNNVDLKAVWQRIHVVRVPAYSPHSIAEHAVALLLCMTRSIHKAYNRVREGNFLLNGLTGGDLFGKTAGIVSTGKIGKITAAILHGIGMRILVYDKFPDVQWAQTLNAEYVDFEKICKESDVISLHAPLTPETFHMINKKTLALMKHNAVIINTGRGALIDTHALVNALKHQKIGGAGLDVYEEEEHYFFEDWSSQAVQDDTLARLLTFPNVIITGHQAFLTEEALSAIAQTTLENIEQFFKTGSPLPNEVCYQCSNIGSEKCKHTQQQACF